MATLQLPHGCEVGEAHLDTTRVEVEIPASFGSVKPSDSVFGRVSRETNEAETVTKLIWEKDEADVRDEDFLYTQFVFRGTPVAGTQLTSLEFRTVQFCGENQVAWEGADVPKLKVYPARKPGWNRYTAQSALNASALTSFFGDAQIVWYNNAAYSSNTVTQALITNTLTSIPVGGEFWVKY